MPGPSPRDRAFDPVREHRILVGVGVLPEGIGDAGGDGLAGDRLAALPGEEDEGKLRVLVADRFEERESVAFREIVVADHTLDGPVEPIEPVVGGGFGHDVEPFPVEKRRDGRVVHAQHPDRIAHARILVAGGLITAPCRQQGPTAVVDDTTASGDRLSSIAFRSKNRRDTRCITTHRLLL